MFFYEASLDQNLATSIISSDGVCRCVSVCVGLCWCVVGGVLFCVGLCWCVLVCGGVCRCV